MLVAEIKLKKAAEKEDSYILSRKHNENTQITYILSIGVFKEFRRLGIGNFILFILYESSK
jgi:ribosomal protein S18 acetylase RimI-like enzyme